MEFFNNAKCVLSSFPSQTVGKWTNSINIWMTNGYKGIFWGNNELLEVKVCELPQFQKYGWN